MTAAVAMTEAVSRRAQDFVAQLRRALTVHTLAFDVTKTQRDPYAAHVARARRELSGAAVRVAQSVMPDYFVAHWRSDPSAMDSRAVLRTDREHIVAFMATTPGGHDTEYYLTYDELLQALERGDIIVTD